MGLSTYARVAEITSGRAISQQGLTATCKDPHHRVSHRHPDGVIPGQLAGLELRHRQHARVEDRVRQAKATGLPNLPFHSFQANSAWLEIIMAATADRLGQTDRLHRRSRAGAL